MSEPFCDITAYCAIWSSSCCMAHSVANQV